MNDKQPAPSGQGKGAISSHGEVAEEIRVEHEAAMASAQDALHRAIRIGAKLNRVKAEKPHGDFIPWLLANCPFNERTARRYMEAARGWDEIEGKTDSVSVLTLTKVLGLMAKERKPKFLAIPEDQWEFSLESEGAFLPDSPDPSLEYRSDVEFANGAVGAVELVPDEVGGWRVFVVQLDEPDDRSDRLLGYYRSRGAFIWFKWEWYIVGGHIPDHFRPAIAAAGWRSRPADPEKLKRINAEERELQRQELEAYNASLKEEEKD